MFVSRLPALLFAQLVWVSAFAAEVTGGHGSSQFVRSWDENGDGKVSRAEYEDERVKRFAATDIDKSDALSMDEYATRLDGQIAEEKQSSIQQTDTRFRALDKDRDNFIARVEYDASGARAFQHLDPDGDGEVTREQFDTQRAAAFTATDANSDGKLDQSEYLKEFVARLDRQIQTRRLDQLKQAGVRFKSIDDDKNGSITRAEYLAMSTRMFERADTNKDGLVSVEDPTPPRRDREQEGSAVSAAANP